MSNFQIRLHAAKPEESRSGCDFPTLFLVLCYSNSYVRFVGSSVDQQVAASLDRGRSLSCPTRSLAPRPTNARIHLVSLAVSLSSSLALPEESREVSLGITRYHIVTLTRYSDTDSSIRI